MTVTDVAPGRARLKVTLPGRLRSRQGLNLPGSDLAVKSLTDKDLPDLDWTARHAADVQFVGLSFVRTPDDVAWLRQRAGGAELPGPDRGQDREAAGGAATWRRSSPRPTA